jgi:hypothetical protein
MAFRHLGNDQLAEDAIREKLKIIRLKNVKDKAAMKISFADGVLEMHCAYGLRTEGIYNENDIYRTLLAGL